VGRAAVLGVAAVFVAVLGGLTLYVLVTEGPDVLVLLSLAVVAILGYGVGGAIATPPEDR
jgi:hypothetical protein